MNGLPNTKLLAIDPGTNKLGLAVFHDEKLIATKTIKTKEVERYKRTQDIFTNLIVYLNMHYSELRIDNNRTDYTFVCEEPAMQGKANTVMQRLLGGLEAMIAAQPNYIHPMTLKSRLGSGKLEKIEVAKAALKLLKTTEEKLKVKQLINEERFDETDAVALGLAFFIKSKDAKKKKKGKKR